ncbi:MAG: SGNH/GDSL hydrolase family protein [Xenococcaceae cyanobacterium MO_188.B19]|nr:SGNH/GDSL hydrolase family protein [Xenococcaceae cyanobacterium MO_188.B19]
MKIVLIIITTVISSVVLAEAGLRLILGLGNPPLYVADEEIGYLLAPNQNLKRMGNKIQTNQYSMRSEAIADTKPDSLFRVLLLGDSIVNGGWWTDQEETISTSIKNKLTSDGNSVQVLNASANSWGPRNELAYLKRFGVFESQVLVLVINTDDLFATAPNSAPVGRDRNYPDQKPLLALTEAYERFIAKPKPLPNQPEEKGDRVGLNLAAIGEISRLAKAQNSKFILTMTPLLREFGETGSRDYEKKARKRLQEFAVQEQIIYIDFLPIFTDFPQPEFLYRDHIHLSPQGNHLVSETLTESLKSFLYQNK